MQKWHMNTFATGNQNNTHMSKSISSSIANDCFTQKNYDDLKSYVKKFLAAKNYCNPNFYDNDLIIDGAVNHVAEKIASYDPSKSTFFAWATKVAINHAMTLMRKYSKCAMGMAESYDRGGDDDDCDDLGTDFPATLDFPCDDDPLENLEYSNALKIYCELAESYKDNRRDVARMLLKGYTRDEIKDALGISDNELSIYKCRIKKNFISRLCYLSSYRATA